MLYWLTDVRVQVRLIPIAVGGDHPAPFREFCKAGGAAIGTQPISRRLCRCHHRPADIAQHLLPVIRLVVGDHSVKHMDQLVGDSADRLVLLQGVTLPGCEVLVDLLEIRVALDQTHCCLNQDRSQPFSASPTELPLALVLAGVIELDDSHSGILHNLLGVGKSPHIAYFRKKAGNR